ncbi:hypothetical protein N657DRAFT_646392 [Parathielavia appendiculata]|uniref:Uncharacterized protein n=1 Tax=Parathielavia appendiculata TaxID=2587402 RepID=A0AAN6TXR4_9PEZI|nr:hypothetical protein N657DRAFT_646392 [Parathielavia appendiculata]
MSESRLRCGFGCLACLLRSWCRLMIKKRRLQKTLTIQGPAGTGLQRPDRGVPSGLPASAVASWGCPSIAILGHCRSG